MKFGRLIPALLLTTAMMLPGTLPATAMQTSPKVKTPADASMSGQIDINSATKNELQTLPGVGTVYAQKIIDGRPYASKIQLKSRGIVPAKVYQQISGKIIAKQPPAKSAAK